MIQYNGHQNLIFIFLQNEEDNDGDKEKQERKDQLDDDQIKSNPAYM